MFQIAAVAGVEEDAQTAFRHSGRRGECGGVAFPFLGVYFNSLRGHDLSLAHRRRVGQFHPYFRFFPVSLCACPYAEPVCLSLAEGYTEETFVAETCRFVPVAGRGKPDVVRVAFKRAVVPYGHISETFPAHQ